MLFVVQYASTLLFDGKITIEHKFVDIILYLIIFKCESKRSIFFLAVINMNTASFQNTFGVLTFFCKEVICIIKERKIKKSIYWHFLWFYFEADDIRKICHITKIIFKRKRKNKQKNKIKEGKILEKSKSVSCLTITK